MLLYSCLGDGWACSCRWLNANSTHCHRSPQLLEGVGVVNHAVRRLVGTVCRLGEGRGVNVGGIVQ